MQIFCPNCDWFLAAISRKNKKWAIFDILLTTTTGVNMTTRLMIPFFLLLFELYVVTYFIFAFQVLKNSIQWYFVIDDCSWFLVLKSKIIIQILLINEWKLYQHIDNLLQFRIICVLLLFSKNLLTKIHKKQIIFQ